MIAEVLLAAEPGSRIVGEELSPELVTEGLVWIVDPLDGTTNFLHDFPGLRGIHRRRDRWVARGRRRRSRAEE